MPELHKVLRTFEGPNGRKYQPGETVDTTGWRWTRSLVERRYLAPVPVAPPEDARPARRPVPA